MICANCPKKFNPDVEPGGLFISQPVSGETLISLHFKFHLCAECSMKLGILFEKRLHGDINDARSGDVLGLRGVK